MAVRKTRPYDAAEYLETEDDATAYLQAALEDDDPAIVIHVLDNIARARSMSSFPLKGEFDERGNDS
jgi:probable addiction module antidote protein